VQKIRKSAFDGFFMKDCSCRLCGASATAKFRLCVLDHIEVWYFECVECGSLQTEEPYWLMEAYEQSNLACCDVGAAQRVLINYSFVALFAKLLRLKTILDFGGGDGLLCRLLRDRGLDAYTMDEFKVASYAQRFVGSLERSYDLVTAFEVIEHFPNPRESLARLFRCRPRLLLVSTMPYAGNGSDWWYLAPNSGQHVFFYSAAALRLIADRHDYYYYAINGRHVFAKTRLSRLQMTLLSLLTGNTPLKLYRAYLPFSESWTWIQRDLQRGMRHENIL
jgi:hypothetical protein